MPDRSCRKNSAPAWTNTSTASKRTARSNCCPARSREPNADGRDTVFGFVGKKDHSHRLAAFGDRPDSAVVICRMAAPGRPELFGTPQGTARGGHPTTDPILQLINNGLESVHDEITRACCHRKF